MAKRPVKTEYASTDQLSFDDWSEPPRRGRHRGKLERAFAEFHEQHPEVYRFLVFYAREWKRSGRTKCSAMLLYQRARWQMSLDDIADDDADGIKLNNNHVPFYARLIESQEPDLHGLFKFRKQRVQCSFGPDNADLPSGDHVA